MQDLDIRDVSILDALPAYLFEPAVLTVGCGKGRIEWHMTHMGYDVLATDVYRAVVWEDTSELKFELLDILADIDYEKYSRPIVVCSEVLEHIKNYKKALENLVKLASIRLIITVPFERSFWSPDHINTWDDSTVGEFYKLCKPYSVSISKIRTKPRDVELKQWCYLIVVDKRQCYE